MCDCVKLTNEALAKDNLVLSQAIVLRQETHSLVSRLYITTEKIDKQAKGKPIKLMVSNCPFCGEKLETL